MGSETSFLDRIRDNFSIILDRNTLLTILITVIGFLVWLMAFPLFGPILSGYFGDMKALVIEKGRILQIFLLLMTVFSVVFGYIIDKTGRRMIFIWISTVLGSLLTIALYWVDEFLLALPIIAILGIVASISQTAWGTFFADYTAPEDRGRIMGLCVALSMPISYSFILTRSLNVGGLKNLGLVILGLIYLLSISTILLKPKDKEISEREARRSRGAGTRQIVLYTVPVFLFYIVLGVLLSSVFPTIQDNITADRFYLMWVPPVFLGALLGGIQLDMRGRKFPMIVGLAITGVSLAVIGILGIRSGLIAIIPLAIGYSIVTISSLIIWSDLAPMKSRGLHYGIGFGIMGLALLIGLMVSGGGFGSISVSRIRSFMFFSAVALFLCIPPLIVAEDALPKEIIEKRQMEEHLKRARERMLKK
jgi:MFS family permease